MDLKSTLIYLAYITILCIEFELSHMVQDELMLRKQENQKLIEEQSNVFSLLAEKKELERRVTNLMKQNLGMINFD